MSRLLQNHWLHRSLLIGVLIALGLGIYVIQPPAPMCVIVDEKRAVPLCFAAEGRRLVTATKRRQQAPLIVSDTRTGLEVLRLPNKGQKHRVIATAVSQDGRYVAAEIREYGDDEDRRHNDFHSIFLVDTRTDTVHELPIVDALNSEALHFSPRGDLLLRPAVRPDADKEDFLRIWDTGTGKLVDQRPTWGGGGFVGDLYLHTIPNDKGYTIVELWSVCDRKAVANFENVGQYGGVGTAGRYYAARRVNAEGLSTTRRGVWSLTTYRLEAEFDTSAETYKAFSHDGRWLAYTGKDDAGAYLEIRELPSGRLAGPYRAEDGFCFDWVWFSPDGRFVFVGDLNEKSELVCLSLPALKVCWKIPSGPIRGMCFSPDASVIHLFRQSDLPDLRSLECGTGTPHATIPLPKSDVFIDNPMHPSRDGRRILLHRASGSRPIWLEWLPQQIPWLNGAEEAQTDTIMIVDAESCRPCFRLHTRDMNSFLLSDDGRTLATASDGADGRFVIRVWDVDARKPLHWSIGVPATLAALGMLSVWWSRRRRAKPEK